MIDRVSVQELPFEQSVGTAMASSRWSAVLFVVVGAGTFAIAQEKPKTVAQGKAATALLIAGERSATAFCIHESGYFATNQHVIKAVKIGGEVKLVMRPSEPDEKEYAAKLVRADAERDLAVLRVVEAGRFVALELGRTDRLEETQRLLAFGYPFGEQLAVNKTAHPSVSVNAGNVTSLRRAAGKLEAIQVDVLLNPGNSGGPVLDQSGLVVGIVRAGILGAGINFVTPVERLKELLVVPDVWFDPPRLSRDAASRSVQFKARPVWLLKGNAAPVKMQLEINAAGEPSRRLDMSPSADGFDVAVVPLPQLSGPQKVRVYVEFDAGSIRGEVIDASFRMGSETVWLHDLESLEFGASPVANLRRVPPQLRATPQGLGKIQIDVGPVQIPVDLTKAKLVRVDKPKSQADAVTVAAIVMRDGNELARRTFKIQLDGDVIEHTPLARTSTEPVTSQVGVPRKPGSGNRAPATNRPAAVSKAVIPVAPEARTEITAPTLAGAATVRELPGIVTDVAVGGGGRFLVLQLAQLRKLAIFDVNEGRITKYVPLAEDNISFAAGNSKLIVVLCDSRIIQRWSLATAERELTATLPVEGVVKSVAMGSASGGPLLIHLAKGTDSLDPAHFELVDIQSFKNYPIVTQGRADRGLSFRDQLQIRASANGEVFGMWELAVSPSGLQVLVLRNSTATMFYDHQSVGHVVPSADGRHICTGAGIYTQELRRLDTSNLASGAAIPSHGGGFFLRGSFPNSGTRENPKSTTLSVYMESDLGRPIVAIPNLDISAPTEYGRGLSKLSVDKRVHFVPDAKLLITIPGTNDRLLLHRFDLEEALDNMGVDYLFIASTPPPSAKSGTRFEYAVSVKSKKGGVTYKLESGPEGMTVSPAGVVTWDIPADFQSSSASVILSVTDSVGQERFHSFTLSIER